MIMTKRPDRNTGAGRGVHLHWHAVWWLSGYAGVVARVRTVAFQGIEVLDIDVQVQMSGGIVAFTIVGLPDKAVAESRERVRSSLHALGLGLPPKRITVNLAPADVLKEGSHFDLPIALGLLTVMGVLPGDEIARYVALGELALDGSLTPVAGVLPAAVNALARERGLICPLASGGEAAWAGDLDVLAPASLLALINHINSEARTYCFYWIKYTTMTHAQHMCMLLFFELCRDIGLIVFFLRIASRND